MSFWSTEGLYIWHAEPVQKPPAAVHPPEVICDQIVGPPTRIEECGMEVQAMSARVDPVSLVMMATRRR
jgi:hypothetical protein